MPSVGGTESILSGEPTLTHQHDLRQAMRADLAIPAELNLRAPAPTQSIDPNIMPQMDPNRMGFMWFYMF